MAYASVSSAYRETKIKTASQGQLIIMLYDAAIKQLDTSLELLKPARGGPSGNVPARGGRGGSPGNSSLGSSSLGNRSAKGSPARDAGNGSPAPEKIEKIGKAILKAQEIITELMVSLDFEAGGEIARNLFSLYSWFNQELLAANIAHDARRVYTVRNMINELRGAWNEAAVRIPAETVGRPAVGVNIAG